MSAHLLTIVCIIAALISESEPRAVNFTDCGSQEGKTVKLDITPCDSNPCIINRGTDEAATLTFVVYEFITSLHLKVWAIIDGLNIPVPIRSDACQGYGLTCPIKVQQTTSLVIKKHIGQDVPTGKFSIKTELIDPEEKTVACLIFPVDVK